MTEWKRVIEGDSRYALDVGDVIEFGKSLPDDSIDLLITSPPYEDARTYGLPGKMPKGETWVKWMVEFVTVFSPKVKGLMAIVCEGKTRNFSYSCVPFLLMADLKRAGFVLRKPPVFSRVGIPGSGGPDWLRNDYEPIVCVTRKGKLPWSKNTACGHPPKWAPGGEMSHRLGGRRRTQWGGSEKSGGHRQSDGSKTAFVRPSHIVVSNDDERVAGGIYVPPVLANPGNVIQCIVGGGVMGHPLATDNEAPFPLKLADFFVKSFCPPGGITCDPFFGSATSCHAAVANGRRFVGCDLRESQRDLAERRMADVRMADVLRTMTQVGAV